MPATGVLSACAATDSISGSAMRTGESSQLHVQPHPWRMQRARLARLSILSKRKPEAFWDCLSPPRRRSDEQVSGSNRVCSSWFLLVTVQAWALAIRMREGAIRPAEWCNGLSVREGEQALPAAHTLNSQVVCREERCGNRRKPTRRFPERSNHGTGKNSGYSGVLVRIQWS